MKLEAKCIIKTFMRTRHSVNVPAFICIQLVLNKRLLHKLIKV